MLDGMDAELDDAAATGPHALSDAELHERVVAWSRLLGRLAALQARDLAAWEARRTWASDGSKSPAARLARECGVPQRTANTALWRARRLAQMPVTARALSAGEVSVDQADELARAWQPERAEVFARDEALLVDQAQRLSFADLHRVVRYWEQRADAVGVEDRARQQHEGRHLDVARSFADTVDVRGVLDPVDGTIVLNELERLEQAEFEHDWQEARAEHGAEARQEHLARTPGQRRADALVEMARRSAAKPGHHIAARPLITVLVGYETLKGPVCELADGTVVSPGQIVPLLNEADIERVVFDTRARPFEVSVRQRLFTGATRRAIEVRDRHCTHPGCDEPPHHCQVDHIVPWSMGGPTTVDNGRLLCGVHNRQRPRSDHGPAP